ncbi:S-methyl-5'-thioadenosine phosphorylase [Propioniciclava sp.]|uniref:S-methyl-5'-thioadenosine phosphorylase n=1 Tax=Propioniciclava sp. TaxID=2038686 RepID=UPI00262D56CE|nr:S-methyl-5'-thioadenosine phosphorylase [Propioniciclava sp.]
MTSASAEIGIIGGSGFYSFFDAAGVERVEVETPFGAPSGPLTIGEVAGRRVAFLPRHGERHQFAPHTVNYRANLWALRSVGVGQVLGPCAVGGLQRHLEPGTFVVPDQVVDRTYRAGHTVWEAEGPVVHVPFADPYCPRGRAALLASESEDTPLVDGGTLVVINGPRFSSRAESRWHAAAGWSVVGMTGMPEASVARELALCFSTVCCVTDLDAGVEGEEGVTHAEVLAVFAGNIERLKALLLRTIAVMPTGDCACRHVLDGMDLPFALP